MSGPEHQVEYLGTALRSTMSGQSAATGYRFRVDQKQEVSESALDGPGMAGVARHPGWRAKS